MDRPTFDPTPEEIGEELALLAASARRFFESRQSAPAVALDGAEDLVRAIVDTPPGPARPLAELLATLEAAASVAVDTANPGYLAYIPGGGLWTAAVADLWAGVVNRYVGLAGLAPALVALERSVLAWACELFRLPVGAGGVLTSGGSMANLAALVAARESVAGSPIDDGVVYVGEHCHRSMAKAARIAGVPAGALRTIPSRAGYVMDADALHAAITEDRARGRRPWLVVASAGTTDTGAVDPLGDIAEIASRFGLWLHVDAAYGGFFQLTERGQARLAGIDRADSITLDPHKSLFLGYGTGCLLVRDEGRLRAAMATDGAYLQDLVGATLPDFADLSPELSREARGVRLWLALHRHGVAAFRAALDDKLDLAQLLATSLRHDDRIDILTQPTLTTVVFRLGSGDDQANSEWLARINASGRVFLSSTRLDDAFTLRACILSHRTDRHRIDEAIEVIRGTI